MLRLGFDLQDLGFESKHLVTASDDSRYKRHGGDREALWGSNFLPLTTHSNLTMLSTI